MKYDKQKPPIHLVPVDPIIGAANTLKFGAEKYGEHNWRDDMKETSFSRSYSSVQRHLLSFWMGEDTDPESGLPHLDHALTQLMILIMQTKYASNMDDRYIDVNKEKYQYEDSGIEDCIKFGNSN